MDVIKLVLQILLLITSLLLTLLILLHKGRGGGTWAAVIIGLGLVMRFSVES